MDNVCILNKRRRHIIFNQWCEGGTHSRLFKKASTSTSVYAYKTGIIGFCALVLSSSICYTSMSGVDLLIIDELTESDLRELF